MTKHPVNQAGVVVDSVHTESEEISKHSEKRLLRSNHGRKNGQ